MSPRFTSHHGLNRAARAFFAIALSVGVLAAPGATRIAAADTGWSFGLGSRRERDAVVSLHVAELQPLTHGLAFRVEQASVKDRQLWVIGEIHNRSNVRYEQVRVVVGVDGGADQRLTVGQLLPRTSRRVQARLATGDAAPPATVRITVTEARTDHRPQPYRWQ